jgi:hypothetical protein
MPEMDMRLGKPPAARTYSWKDARAMTEAELSDHVFAFQADVDAIKGQIETAIRRFHAEGRKADPVWFSKARKAYRHKVLQLSMMQQAWALLRRETSRYWAEEFVRQARGAMSERQWRTIKESVDEEIQAFRDRRASIGPHEGDQPEPAPELPSTG